MPKGPENYRSHPLRGRVNGRTPRGRRFRALYRSFMTKLPDDDANASATALRAAELTIIAEDLRARIVAGEVALDDQLVRIENLAARARREVARLEDPDKGVPTIAEIYAQCGPADDDAAPDNES
jgi:hypothetical protein